MKFIVATYGTEGDARPFAALCRGLMDAGHESRLLADAATLGSAWPASRRPPWMADGSRLRHSPALSTSPPLPGCETAPERWARRCARRMAL